jgi:rSAM/selenodomain-associated transferase 2
VVRAGLSSKPSLSVIIPAVNEAESIQRAVESAWAANVTEVLVVDGGSTDPTAERAVASGATLLTSNRGRAAQQNAGARAAQGDVLVFLHADNWLCPDAGDQMRMVLQRAEVGCGAFRQCIAAEPTIYRWIEQGNAWRVRWRGLPYGDQGIFVRNELFWRQGGFPEIPLMEDLVFMRGLRRICWPVLLPGPLHVDSRRWQRHGVLRQTVRNWGLVAAYQLGVTPERLASRYRPHDDGPSRTDPDQDHDQDQGEVEVG